MIIDVSSFGFDRTQPTQWPDQNTFAFGTKAQRHETMPTFMQQYTPEEEHHYAESVEDIAPIQQIYHEVDHDVKEKRSMNRDGNILYPSNCQGLSIPAFRLRLLTDVRGIRGHFRS